ncbi:MAG: hypothetical protein ACHQUC_04505 [Chlamydiales bacterium]
MTSKHGKQASDAGTASSHAMTIEKFNKELKKESPKMFKKVHGEEGNPYSSEKEFLDELKTHAPKVYEELKKSNFKFRLDEHTKDEWMDVLDRSSKLVEAIQKCEQEVEDVNAHKK